ncbi:hypothetical protein F8388_013726 [Cannabis sativa]|uniref:PGG domain-containing protein n=1 Tax=Cannabis sativa TaxID=3483 RepID=A0A7J6G5K7_CANSA|nr:hypothetical protein F8388_013726 [Cannabis sativa]
MEGVSYTVEHDNYQDAYWTLDSPKKSQKSTDINFILPLEDGVGISLLDSSPKPKGFSRPSFQKDLQAYNKVDTKHNKPYETHTESQSPNEVKKIVQPSYEKAKNKKGKNPEELFCLEHKRLLREGETWMKHTAQSCMLVATLIATVVFAAAFSLPGGNNDKGSPNDLAKTSFLIFVLSDGIALLNSIVAMVMFLSILISRYTEYDFLKRLPLKLIIGLTSLFFSMIAMMVAFSFAFVLAYDHGIKWVPLLISMLAIVPIALFAVLKFPLVLDTFNSTYCSGTLFRPRHMLN